LLARETTDAFVEQELGDALCRLNLDIAAQPERADEVNRKLCAILIAVGNVGLVYEKLSGDRLSETADKIRARGRGAYWRILKLARTIADLWL